jgi:sulfur transfer complex TusBCD TusB component (DsrH family)
MKSRGRTIVLITNIVDKELLEIIKSLEEETAVYLACDGVYLYLELSGMREVYIRAEDVSARGLKVQGDSNFIEKLLEDIMIKSDRVMSC